MDTVRLTSAQGLIRFLDNQYVEVDGHKNKFVKGVFGIFGHGNVTGIGEALLYGDHQLSFYQGHNEQGMVHAATAYAKQKNRLEIFACTSSIGPGAMNMVTGAAVATTNRLPILLLPGDIFACRQPDPVLQQIEDPADYTITANDCFKPVSKYWDRITRPEQIMSALLNAFRVLTDPVDTGAVTLCLPQDVQAEAFDYPLSFFEERIWYIDRRTLSDRSKKDIVNKLQKAKRPLIIAGGGVHYSLATDTLKSFAEKFRIPVAETQAGKSTMSWLDEMSVGGVGVTGTKAANGLLKRADLIFAIGTRLSDFTTMSKYQFGSHKVDLISLNVSAFDGYKMGATLLQADAKIGLSTIHTALEKISYQTASSYQTEIKQLKAKWNREVDRLYNLTINKGNSQTAVLGALNRFMQKEDVIICAAGSLPGDLHRLWRCELPKTYHVEYAFSCMGYEVAAGLGVKLASPKQEVYVIVGDGSYLMLHSELLTSIQEKQKINIILLDNHGYQCIRNLQQSQGCENFGNEFRYREAKTNQLTGQIVEIDFHLYAQALGAKTFYAKNIEEFKQALTAAKQATHSTLIEIKVAPDTMSHGYDAWWRVGVPEISPCQKVKDAYDEMEKLIRESKVY